MKTDKMRKAFGRYKDDLLLQAYLMAAWDRYMHLSWGRFLWYTFLFFASDGLILLLFPIFFWFKKRKSDRMYEKWLKNKADLEEKSQDLGENG